MNLRAIANRSTRMVNPNLMGTVRVCTGYTTAPTGKRVATYAPPAPIELQVQALSVRDHQYLQAQNITTVERVAFANIQLTAIDRLTSTGGDLLQFEGKVWNVQTIFEEWTTSGGWCKVGLVQQMDAVV